MSSKKSEIGFELYKSLGAGRSYARVADLMGLSEKTIKSWGSREKWQDRLNSELIDLSSELKSKRQLLELKGLNVALNAMGVIDEKLEKKEVNKELAQTYEIFLKTPLSVGETVNLQSACATPAEDKNIEIKFDIDGGVSNED